MKIAYVFHEDAADPSIRSGAPTSLLHEFEKLGLDVERVFPLDVPQANTDFAKKVGYRLLGKFHRGDRSLDYLTSLAAQFEQRTGGKTFDFVFSPGSEVVSQLQTDLPVAFCADATFASLVDYYWDFTGLSAEYRRNGHAQEAAALAKATLAVFPSEWAARSAIDYYGTDRSKVAVIPMGANLGGENERFAVRHWIDQRSPDHIRLLFVGRHWERKGGELVIATAHCLIAHGYPVIVDVVGCDLPARHRDIPWIRPHGLLHQNNPAEMERLSQLYAQAHFVFVPSRAEAYGFTFCEACAFGAPPISTSTGGIPAIIHHDVNGLLLPVAAKAPDYADAIVAAFSDPARYRQMAHRAFEDFEQRLNWRTFTREFIRKMEERLATVAAEPPEETPTTAPAA
ncbi:MAG TPA: glycosyltransferase family 4 protein [Candidatus Didemnitutus sp.]|nr:glycosyltransferase family 4 protein [Candidatus Didemnitutus sp.]